MKNHFIFIVFRSINCGIEVYSVNSSCVITKIGVVESHPILLSEISLPEIEVPIEKLLPDVLGRLGKEKPS